MNGNTKADLESSMGLTFTDFANGKTIATPAFAFVTYVKGQAICFTGNFAGTVKFGFNTDKPIKATFALEIDGVIVSEFSFEKPENGSFGKEVVMYEQLSAGEHTIRLILTDIKGAGYGSWSAANVTKISIGVAQPQGTETGTEA